MRFEYFLTLLKECEFIIGNSSSGIREACAYGKSAIDIGNRQKGRYNDDMTNINHVNEDSEQILQSINKSKYLDEVAVSYFGDGKSDEKFLEIICSNEIWENDIQKKFIDLDF